MGRTKNNHQEEKQRWHRKEGFGMEMLRLKGEMLHPELTSGTIRAGDVPSLLCCQLCSAHNGISIDLSRAQSSVWALC